MSGEIMLSVIVPVYNTEDTLPDALDSLLNIEADFPYEIIAVDDGSKDKSLIILREYEEVHPEIRVIAVENGGVSRARNLGIAASRGKYLTFADSDDTAEPGFFREAVREMEENGYSLVQGDARFLQGTQSLMVLPGCGRRSSGDPDELLEWFYGRNQALLFSVWAKVYRRETVGDIRFPEDIRIAEDQKFLFDMLRKKPKVLITDTVAYNYVIRESSVMQSGYAEKGWDVIRVLENCSKKVDSPQILRYIDKQKTDVWIRIYNTATLNGKDAGKALQAVRDADIQAIRRELSRKEWIKLVLLRHSRGLYDILLKVVKF